MNIFGQTVGYQSDVINLLDGEEIGYTITADLDEAAGKSHPSDPGGKLAAV